MNVVRPPQFNEKRLTKLDHALAHAKEGFRVFPIHPNTKIPAVRKWPNLATTDETQIRQWWGERPDANIGISTNGLLVVDIDPKRGGAESWAGLVKTSGAILPDTRVSRTWSGGAHIVYQLPEGLEVASDVDVLGPGLDVRGKGGQIVAPGSVINGESYAWVNAQEPIGEAVQCLIDACKTPKAKSALAGKRVVEEDEDTHALCRKYLDIHAPAVAEGARDDTAVAVANRFYDFGTEIDTCEEYLVDWSDRYCEPPMAFADIHRVANSAPKSRQKPIGCDHPLASKFEPVEITPRKTDKAEPATREPFRSIPAGEAATKALTHVAKPLVKGLLTRGGLSIIYGPPNSGKSFIGLDLGYHIGKGVTWAGKRVHRGAVLYVAAEGGASIFARLAALERHYGDLKDVALHILPQAIDLLHGTQDADAVVTEARRLEQEHGVKVELIVVDTVARAMSGGDENSSQDMGAFIKHLDRVRAGAGCHVCGIHHTGKDKSRGARGHSSLLGAVDTEIEVDSNAISVTKQRDMERAADLFFTLKPTRIGVDDDGDEVTSCYVELRQKGAAAETELLSLPPDLQELLDEMIDQAQDAHADGGLSPNRRPIDFEFAAQCYASIRHVQPSELATAKGGSRSTVRRALATLTNSGHLRKIKRGQWLISDGQIGQIGRTASGVELATASTLSAGQWPNTGGAIQDDFSAGDAPDWAKGGGHVAR